MPIETAFIPVSRLTKVIAIQILNSCALDLVELVVPSDASQATNIHIGLTKRWETG